MDYEALQAWRLPYCERMWVGEDGKSAEREAAQNNKWVENGACEPCVSVCMHLKFQSLTKSLQNSKDHCSLFVSLSPSLTLSSHVYRETFHWSNECTRRDTKTRVMKPHKQASLFHVSICFSHVHWHTNSLHWGFIGAVTISKRLYRDCTYVTARQYNHYRAIKRL